MRDLLAPRNRALVTRLASKEVLLGFDLDGTLAPIAASPAKARMRPRTKRLLRQVAARYPCAVITGRLRESAARLLEGAEVRWIVGNHGLEWPDEAAASRYLGRVESWKRALAPLCSQPGLQLEDKRFTLSIHVRHAADPRAAQREAYALASRLPGCRAELGIEVVNLIPTNAPDKAHALRRLLKLSGCRHAIYLGDDVTDEAVFRMTDARVLSVLVGRRAKTGASYRLGTQDEVDLLLALLLRARPSTGEAARAPKNLAVKLKSR